MTTDDLRGLLRNERFTGTPPVNPERTGQIERRIARRRRRLRGTVAATAATVLAVAGLSAVATRALSGDGGDPAVSRTATPSPLPKVALPRAVPAEKLWPQAVAKLPPRLPNGKKYFPEAFADDHTLLVTTRSSFEKTDAVWLYDTETRQLRQVTRVVTPPKATIFASGFAVGDNRVAWWTSRRGGGGTVTEIWSAPLSGGEQSRVATLPAEMSPGNGLARLVITGGKVIWSLSTFKGARGGIVQVPFTGGEPSRIPGTDGYHIVDWPWVGAPDRFNGQSAPVAFKDLRNLVTGERRVAKVGSGQWTCDLTWCVRFSGRGTVVMRRDGSDGRVLAGSGATDMIARDRFVVSFRAKTLQLYDLRTGKLGDLGLPRQPDAFRMVGPSDRLYWMDGNEGYVIVNLAAIR